ncbi:pyridoxal phosphate-dependent aminotransferase [Streptomyces sp. NPDC002537]
MVSHAKNAKDAKSAKGAARTPDQITGLLAAIADPERRLAAHADLFPDALNLATAENVLLYPSLREHVFAKLGTIAEENVRYATAYGTDHLRLEIGEMLRPVLSPSLDHDDIFGTSGVSAALECLAFALKDRKDNPLRSGDRVLLPAPFWQGFKWCFEQRPELVCVPVALTAKGAGRFELTLEDLQRAYHQQPEPPRLLVLTNPNNPLGVNYDKELLERIHHWALEETEMHIISDEMYAHSQLTDAAPPFVSALALDAYRLEAAKDRVHVVWGFAKDFGLSGFKAGVVISRSPAVQEAMKGTPTRETSSWFSPFDSLKHFVIGELLAVREDGRSYALALMEQYRSVLTTAFRTVRTALDTAKVPYLHREGANSAQFFWLDLRDWLPRDAQEIPYGLGPHFPDAERVPERLATETGKPGASGLPVLFSDISSAEEWLRRYIAEQANVLLLPGQTLSCPEPGYFRLCFTAFGTPTVVEAVQRLGEALDLLGRRA